MVGPKYGCKMFKNQQLPFDACGYSTLSRAAEGGLKRQAGILSPSVAYLDADIKEDFGLSRGGDGRQTELSAGSFGVSRWLCPITTKKNKPPCSRSFRKIWRQLKSHTSPEYFDFKTFRLYRHCQSSQRLCELEEQTNSANSATFLLEYRRIYGLHG
jgi:hypothetical protein